MAAAGVRPRRGRKSPPKERTTDDLIRSYQASIPGYGVSEGVPFPGSLVTKRLSDIRDFQVRHDDLFICGYPRSGNHWMKEIVTLLYSDELSEVKDGKHVIERIPLLEMSVDVKQCLQIYMDNRFQRCGPFRPILTKIVTKLGLITRELALSQPLVDPLADLEKRASPRLVQTHLPYRLLPEGVKQGNSKVIYLMRNGKDVAVSFYEMHKMYPPFGYYCGDWKEFFTTYLSGKVCFGSWFEHVKEWSSHRGRPHVLFVKYEDMIEDLPREVKRIASFLGKDVTEETIDEIAGRCTFKMMKENPLATYDGLHVAIDTKKTSFLRRGKVADWKTKLTVEENELFDDVYQSVFADVDPGIRFQLD